ncbi:GntR family transcriptional regulator [Primorskyibacter flagellatus]|uniref:GntR family transcriptional regulator n=1 Tax=Primorskyibacter flagellatus TaxID=1387277 RepID=UPI003A8FE2E7
MTASVTGIGALDPTLPITPQIYRILRDRIIHNDLTPGNRISESEIAALHQVSRQPVREAFIKLAEQGLLAVRPQRGTIVNKIAYSAVLDARFLREAIEADIVSILAQAPDAGLVSDLRKQLDVQRALDPKDSSDFIHLDERFHFTLAAAAGKGGAWKQVEGLKAQMDRVRYLSLSQFPVAKLIGQHETIVDHIADGDRRGANVAIRTHLREVLSDLTQIVAAHPEFFDLPAGELPQPVNAPIL